MTSFPMTAGRIEREILIEAPVDVVWGIVTDPDQIGRWWGDAPELDADPGGAEACEGPSPLIAFTLVADGENTRLRFVHCSQPSR
jgi:uncharacterized protein YndB with AHSA1/START domain